jgi:hypothetical protein
MWVDMVAQPSRMLDPASSSLSTAEIRKHFPNDDPRITTNANCDISRGSGTDAIEADRWVWQVARMIVIPQDAVQHLAIN